MKDELKKIIKECIHAWTDACTEALVEIGLPPEHGAKLTHPSADMILNCAVRIYNTQHLNHGQHIGKSTTSSNVFPSDVPATEKQIHAIKAMGLDYKAGMTKKEAHALISSKYGK